MIQLATEIFREALEVLQGNPYAASAFVELLEVINDRSGQVEFIDEQAFDTYKKHLHRQWVPEDGPFIPKEKTIPIFAAATQLARSGAYPLERLVNGVFVLLGRFESFGFLYRMVVRSAVSEEAHLRFASVLDWWFPEGNPYPEPGRPL